MRLLSPITGRLLSAAGDFLVNGDERWPVVDGIAFLRADRRDLADHAASCLEKGDKTAALLHLLGDQDNWASTPPPSPEARRKVVQQRDELTFRQAMDLLALGPVATYFAHRWSDPTFLSGLALAQAYSPANRDGGRISRFELACGAGHYLRAFGGDASGADIVFAKLWLARHFIAPHATLLCFDAAAPWPLCEDAVETLFCHDAFYFMPDKAFVAKEMLRTSRRVLAGHMHNALVDNLSAGEPLPPDAYARLFPGCTMFDDTELTAALLEARAPNPAQPGALANAAALSLAWGFGQPDRASGPLTDAAPGVRLRRNPLYEHQKIAWPSERYAREYAGLVTYPAVSNAPEIAIAGQDETVIALARRRVLLDLPDRW